MPPEGIAPCQRRENRSARPARPFIILIPLFNDWDTFAKLAVRLDAVLAASDREADILIVDDASVVDPDPRTTFGPYRALRRVEVLRLRRNLGHQRAIAIGLTYIQARMTTAVRGRRGDGRRRRGCARGRAPAARPARGGGGPIDRLRRADPALGVAHVPVLLFPLPAPAFRADQRAGARRQLQRHPAPAAGEPGGGLRALEPLRRRGLPFAAALLHHPHAARPAARRPFLDELRRPGDARPERDLGLSRGHRRPPAGPGDQPGAPGRRRGSW